MANSDHITPEDRQQAALDFRRRVLAWQDQNQELPIEDIYDEPVRYYKLNKVWAKIIWGLLNHLEQPAAWPLAVDQDYSGIQQVMKYEEGINLALEIDCEQIEDCIEVSPTITTINNNITTINQQITEVQECCNEQNDNNPIDGVELPPNPDMPSGADDLCKSANYIAMRIGAELLEVWAQAQELTMQEFVNAILGTLWWNFEKARAFWQYATTIGNEGLAALAQADIPAIQNHFFCQQLNREAVLEAVQADDTIPILEQQLWYTTIENYTQAQIDEMAAIGTLGETTPDCSEGCPWVIVFDFAGNYTPDGFETLIIPSDTWEVSGGTYDSAVGYVAFADVMTIEKLLPEQCRLSHYYTSTAKGGLCAAVDNAYWWRGINGTDAEGWSNAIRNLSATFTEQNFTVLGDPLMTKAAIHMDAFFCGSPPAYGQKIEWVKLVGTGAYPQS